MSKNNVETPGYRPCVGIMLLNPQGQVWIGRRISSKRSNDPNGAGLWWQMPQGGIDKGEEPREAAFRELHEETGIDRGQVTLLAETHGWHRYDLPEHVVGRKWGGRFRGQAQKWFAMRFSGRDEQVNITPPAPHEVEFDDWRWAHHSELLELIVPFKRQVYEAVLEEFSSLLDG
jgi:putative (di)nucleoside polyphosphate hydrolase